MNPAALHEALRLIRSTPGYTGVGVHLAQLSSEGRIHVDPDLPERDQAGLLGTVALGERLTASMQSTSFA